MGHLMPTIRVDRDVYDALYERRLPTERNHNGAISRALTSKETTMQLIICLDGVAIDAHDLSDGDDGFNQSVERGVLDRAYEAKESNPDSVVSVVIDTTSSTPTGPLNDTEFVAEALELLADLDQGEHTDWERLRGLAQSLRDGGLGVTGPVADGPVEA
jgi:hypothetical protein